MKDKKNTSYLCYTLLLQILVLGIFVPQITLGQYTPLVGIPGIDGANLSFNQYINALYALSISIAALLAVIKIIIAGVKWMLSDIGPSISEAKNDIRSAIIGLVVVISAVLILNTINPKLTETSLFLSPVVVTEQRPTAGSLTLRDRQAEFAGVVANQCAEGDCTALRNACSGPNKVANEVTNGSIKSLECATISIDPVIASTDAQNFDYKLAKPDTNGNFKIDLRTITGSLDEARILSSFESACAINGWEVVKRGDVDENNVQTWRCTPRANI